MKMWTYAVLMVGILAILAASGCMSSGSEKTPVRMQIDMIKSGVPCIGITLYDQDNNPTAVDGEMTVSVLKGSFLGEYDTAYQPIWNGKVNITKGQFTWTTFGHNGISKEHLMYTMVIPNIKPVDGDIYRITATMYPEQFGHKYPVGNWTNIVWA